MKIARVVALLLFTVSLGFGQSYEQIADKTIAYIKAGTFGKPDIAKKTSKVALGQVRVHFKTVTSRASASGKNAADVTVYLDGEMTNGDLQQLTNEFYGTLVANLSKAGISAASFDAIKETEYYLDRQKTQEDKKLRGYDGRNGQAWVSFTAFDGPAFIRWAPYGVPELLGFGKMKKMSKTSETVGGDLMTVDVVVDFASIMMTTDVRQDREGWLYSDPYFHADYSIGGLMNIPQSYVFMVNSKNGFDQYQNAQPVAERFGFADKPRQDASKAAMKVNEYFGADRHTFTPLIIPAKRELYKMAARQVLTRYAEMLATKFAVIRSGGKPSDGKDMAQKPADTTTLQQVKAEAKQNNDTTPITTSELTRAAADATKNGKYKLAVDYYTELIKLDAQNAAYYFERGALTLNFLNDPKSAIKDFDQTIKLNPNEPLAYYNRGTAFIKTQDWKKAKKDFDVAISGRPTYTEAYLNRGIVNLNLKDLDAALADFNKGIQINPRIPNLYRARAIVYRSKGSAALPQADDLRAAQLERGQ